MGWYDWIVCGVWLEEGALSSILLKRFVSSRLECFRFKSRVSGHMVELTFTEEEAAWPSG